MLTGRMTVDKLREVVVEIMDPNVCGHDDSYGGDFDKNVMLCAGYYHGGKDSCSGDSGGALQCRVPGGRWKLTGIVSFGDICGMARRPGVYTRVAKLIDWIKKYIQRTHIHSGVGRGGAPGAGAPPR